MSDRQETGSWIGASVLRKEDARHLLGHGMFIADVRMPGVQDVAFVRSQMAHAHVRRVTKPPGIGRHGLHAGRHRPAQHPRSRARNSPRIATAPIPPLADDRVRYVGQPIAACMQPTRAQAEDLADRVERRARGTAGGRRLRRGDAAGQPARVRCTGRTTPTSPARVNEGDPASLASAPIRLRRQFRMNRQATVSLECRGVLAYWDHRHRRTGRLPLDPGRPCDAARLSRRRSACRRTRSASSRPTSAAASAARTGSCRRTSRSRRSP